MAIQLTNRMLTNIVNEARYSETGAIIKKLGYVPEKYSDEKKQKLSKLFSNLDKPTFFFHLQGILSAALGSKHSRTTEDIRTVLAQMTEDDQRIDEGLSSLNIPDLIHVFGYEFFDRVYSEYGDDSIAQMIPVAVGFENVSMLEAMILFHHRLLAGIEKSSRYKKYDEKKNGVYQYYVDPIFIEAGLDQEFRSCIDSLFDLYSSFCDTRKGLGKNVMDHIRKKTLPLELFIEEVKNAIQSRGWEESTDEEIEDSYKKTIRAMHLDNIRHLLPLATRTMLCLQMNAQNLRDIIINGFSTPIYEAAYTSELLRRES